MLLKLRFLILILAVLLLFGCVPEEVVLPSPSSITVLTQTTPTFFPTRTSTITPTIFSLKTLVFYGDSCLAIGEAGDGIDHVGFSFVSNLGEMMDSKYTLITSNFGGRTAKWAYEHLDENVFSYEPNLLTLWFGLNDMGGCPGFFDRETNRLLDYKLNTIINDHISYLSKIIDLALERGIPVFVLTPIPVLNGKLPWSHIDEGNNIVWEENHFCDFALGEELLVQAQRSMVSDYFSTGKPVFLVDVWQVYMDNPDEGKMYIDDVHPASTGAQLIAEEWFQTFQILTK
jgi:lysophospholipase L1-like esterase